MNKMLHFLCQMPDPSIKQTLCVMSAIDEKPTSWEERKDGKFFTINGHSVAASQKMQAMDLLEKIVKPFFNQNCFIMWLKDKNWLQQILGYYNRCNHLGVFKPTWVTNVLGTRFIWTELGWPTPPKSTTEIGRVVQRTKKDAANNAKYKVNNITTSLHCLGRFELNARLTLLLFYCIHMQVPQSLLIFLKTAMIQEFVDAVKHHFAAINVKKTQSLLKKGKIPEEALDIHNEIKIITSDDSTFALWSEVIASHSQGKLFDLETNSLKQFKVNKSWRPEKDGVFNQEFFKWLRNLTEADHQRFFKHILKRSGDSHQYLYPKVTMKTILLVLIGCLAQRIGSSDRRGSSLCRESCRI